jgi:D-3-phosphoglycerate dehydrogenase
MDRLREAGEVEAFTTRAEGVDELLRRLRGAQAVVNMRAFTRFTEEVFEACPELKIISISGTGTDNVDLGAATRHGVLVCNTPEANSDSVAEHTWALLMALARGLREMEERMRAGEWWHYYGVELKGKTLGLVGLGRIAQRVARMANGFGMRVVGWSYTCDEARAASAGITLVGLEELLAG